MKLTDDEKWLMIQNVYNKNVKGLVWIAMLVGLVILTVIYL